jgi:hypothetical protein
MHYLIKLNWSRDAHPKEVMKIGPSKLLKFKKKCICSDESHYKKLPFCQLSKPRPSVPDTHSVTEVADRHLILFMVQIFIFGDLT